MICDRCNKKVQGIHIHQIDGRDLCLRCDEKEIKELKKKEKKVEKKQIRKGMGSVGIKVEDYIGEKAE